MFNFVTQVVENIVYFVLPLNSFIYYAACNRKYGTNVGLKYFNFETKFEKQKRKKTHNGHDNLLKEVVTFVLNHPIYSDEKRGSVISLIDIRSYNENVCL